MQDELRELSLEELQIVSGGANSTPSGFPPGQFPAGGPDDTNGAPGSSNNPGNSG
jgi:hypothetical protein